MFTTITLALALTGTALVEEADRRNLAYTQCLFAQVREARDASLPETTMLERLDAVCHAERVALEEVMLAVRQADGESRVQAQANWDQVHANSIEAIRRAYVLRLAEQGAR